MSPAAPTAPPKRAPVRPLPQPKKAPSPFNPPKPAILPQPKNRFKKLVGSIAEAMDDEAARHLSNFYNNPHPHKFSNHPIFSKHGLNLARSSFDHTKSSMAKKNIDSSGGFDQQMMRAMPIFNKIMRIESRYKEQLERLAIKIVAEVWGVEDDSILHSNLGNDININKSDDIDKPNVDDDTIADDPRLQHAINKRMTINSITQGSAISHMYSLHHYAREALERLNPQLLELYDKFGLMSVHVYWWMPEFAQLENAAAGSVVIDDNMHVQANALIFPILIQELSKGVAELISLHGLQGYNDRELKHIYKHADSISDEPHHIRIGQSLWRAFIKCVPREIKPADIMMALYQQEPDEMHRIIELTLENPDEAKKMLYELISEPDEFEISDYDSESY